MQGDIPSAKEFINQLIQAGYERGIRYYLEALSSTGSKHRGYKKKY